MTAPSAAQDLRILKFALLLEHLQAAFYREALAGGALSGELREFAEIVADHEKQHVAFLKDALGPRAPAPPKFHFGKATKKSAEFTKAAIALEDTAVAAYNGQGANLTRKTLAAAAEIVSVEGRHSAWIRSIAGEPPAPSAADPALGADEVTSKLKRLGFV